MKRLKELIAIATPLLFCGNANAGIIAVYTPDTFYEAAEIENFYDASISAFIFDLVPDDGSSDPLAGTPVFGDGQPIVDPIPAYSNPVPLAPAYFTASYLGLDVGKGEVFEYEGLDFDTYTGDGEIDEFGVFPLFDGSEYLELRFADGKIARKQLPEVTINDLQTIIFEESDFIAPIPLPASATLMLFGLLGLGAFRFNRKQA